jgi:hypothetical protein
MSCRWSPDCPSAATDAAAAAAAPSAAPASAAAAAGGVCGSGPDPGVPTNMAAAHIIACDSTERRDPRSRSRGDLPCTGREAIVKGAWHRHSCACRATCMGGRGDTNCASKAPNAALTMEKRKTTLMEIRGRSRGRPSPSVQLPSHSPQRRGMLSGSSGDERRRGR